MKNKTGFGFVTELKPVTVMFMDLKGKDAGFNRYRIDCYYAGGRAFTHFEYTAKKYYQFVADRIAVCYETYDEFKARKTEAQQQVAKIKANIRELQENLEELEKEL